MADVTAMAVEQWLKELPFGAAPKPRTRNLMAHAASNAFVCSKHLSGSGLTRKRKQVEEEHRRTVRAERESLGRSLPFEKTENCRPYFDKRKPLVKTDFARKHRVILL